MSELLISAPSGLQILGSSSQKTMITNSEHKAVIFSSKPNLFATLTNSNRVQLWEVSKTITPIGPLFGENVRKFYFSPLTRFLVTEQKSDAGQQNCSLWFLGSQSDYNPIKLETVPVYSLKIGQEPHPIFKFSSNEALLCKLVGNGVNILQLPNSEDLDFFQKLTSDDWQSFISTNTVKLAPGVDMKGKKSAGSPTQFELSNGTLGNGRSTSGSSIFGSVSNWFAGQSPNTELRSQTFWDGSRSDDPDYFFLSLFTPETKGRPATVAVYALQNLEESTNFKLLDEKILNSTPAICSKSFFNAQYVKMVWNKQCTRAESERFAGGEQGLLVFSSLESDSKASRALAAVDDGFGNYYGTITLFYLCCALGEADTSCLCCNLGEIQEASWCPVKNQFLVLHGATLPADLVVYAGGKANAKGNLRVLQDSDSLKMTKVRRNTLIWHPLGLGFCCAGLGNLPGEMDFFVDEEELKSLESMKPLKKVMSSNYEWIRSASFQCCVSMQYSMTEFLGAITAPRVRQDNKAKIFSFAGGSHWETGVIEQLGAAFLLPNSDSDSDFLTLLKQARKEKSDQLGITTNSKASGAYVPPHLRNVKRDEMPKPPKAKSSTKKAPAAAADEPTPVQKRPVQQEVDLVESAALITSPEEAEKHLKKLNKKLLQIEKMKGKKYMNEEEKEKLAGEGKLKEAIAMLEKIE